MARPRALVVATTYPARPGDGTPAFVADLCAELAKEFDVTVVVPAVGDAPKRESTPDASLTVIRHRYFPRRWETVADGAILENVRASRTAIIQVPFLFDPQINLIAFSVSALIGIVFGYFPARRAAALNPIDALRHE